MHILQIETATNVCSVALSRQGVCIASVEGDVPNIHAQSLTLFIEEVLEKAGLQYSDIDAVAVSKGPGSYTGLRIGVSTAKGLCYALDIPLIAVDTLYAMYQGFVADTAAAGAQVFFPMIDARRLEVYTQGVQAGETMVDTHALIVDASSFDTWTAQGQVVLFGNGADKLADIFANHPSVRVASGFVLSATYFSAIAYDKYVAASFEDVAYFEPYYLKDFVVTTPKKKFF